MTYKDFETYELIGKAREACETPNSCSTCRFCIWACDTAGYPADKSIEARCLLIKKVGEGA